MRLLFIHSDHLEFEATEQAGPDDLAETEGVPMAGAMAECATVFISVESEDEQAIDAAVANAVAELEDVTDQLDTPNVVLYPYAHLSEDLARPDAAKSVLQKLEDELTARGYEVLRAPFGWYKSFELSCKGHPLSELSRHVTGQQEEEPENDHDETAAKPSEWHVLGPDGELTEPIETKPALDEEMQAFIEAEVEGETASKGEEPPHVELMREKELVDYDELSDVGNLRYYPRGKFLRDSLMEYVTDLVIEYGGMPVETPIMYDLGVRAINEHAGKFGERQYRFESGNRELMLRFAACFGQFSIMRDMFISESDLPLRIYEMSTYSFRREQKGEVVGLKRLRAFTMPDMHTATADIETAKAEFHEQATLSMASSDDLGLEYVAVVRVTRAFFDDHRAWLEDLTEEIGEPVLLEILPERHHYWSAKIDLAAVDALGRPIENPTVQIDVESADRFDITYNDGEQEHTPIILHYSPTGGIERVMAALLEQAARQETPRLPTWLSPTQVRFIPVGNDHVEYCDELVATLADAGIRADIDDRDESVGKRIATAETDWVPYYAVVGDQELENPVFDVTIRGRDDEELTIDELAATVLDEVGDKPAKPRYLSRYVSDHPDFS